MRHQKNTCKLGRTSAHAKALVAGLVGELILRKRIKTTLPKALAARRLAERMVTLGKKNTLAARRLAAARIGNPESVRELFSSIAPSFANRAGGYTRLVKLPARGGDNAQMALLEWVDFDGSARQKVASGEESAV